MHLAHAGKNIRTEPWNVASLITSLHHANITTPNTKRPNTDKTAAPRNHAFILQP